MDKLVAKSDKKPKRILDWFGVRIGIEQELGQERHWKDPSTGEEGSTIMKIPYGRFLKQDVKEGMDGDGLDVFVGPDFADRNMPVHVIYQMKAPNFDKLDELKIMLGFKTVQDAVKMYSDHYNDERFLGDVKVLTVEEFKNKYELEDVNKAFSNEMLIPQQDTSPDTFEGVTFLLNNVVNYNDNKIMELYKEIWGPGYLFQNQKSENLRNEILGFLMDARDGFQAAQLQLPTQPILNQNDQSTIQDNSQQQGSSPSFQDSTEELPKTL